MPQWAPDNRISRHNRRPRAVWGPRTRPIARKWTDGCNYEQWNENVCSGWIGHWSTAGGVLVMIQWKMDGQHASGASGLDDLGAPHPHRQILNRITTPCSRRFYLLFCFGLFYSILFSLGGVDSELGVMAHLKGEEERDTNGIHVWAPNRRPHWRFFFFLKKKPLPILVLFFQVPKIIFLFFSGSLHRLVALHAALGGGGDTHGSNETGRVAFLVY